MRWALLLVACAVGVRLAAAEMAFRADRGRLLPDEARYLKASDELGTTELPPGYPALLRLERAVSEDLRWLRFCGSLWGALACLVLIPFARAAIPGCSTRLAWTVGWGAALSPLCAAPSAWLLSESLYVPLLVFAGWGLSTRTPMGGLAGGFLLVLAHLVRPIALPLAGLAFPWLWASAGRRTALGLALGVWAACLILGGALGGDRLVDILLPWERLERTARQGWSALNLSGHGVLGADLPADPAAVESAPRTAEPLRLAARKVWGLWRPVPRTAQLRGGWPGRISLVAWLLTMPAALFGAWLALKSWRTAGWLLLLPLYTTLLHAALFTSLRYRMPVEPVLVLLAAWGYWRLLERKPGLA